MRAVLAVLFLCAHGAAGLVSHDAHSSMVEAAWPDWGALIKAVAEAKGKKPHPSGPPVASFIAAGGRVCFEGNEQNIPHAVSAFRAGPLMKFSPHTGIQKRTTCAELGYAQKSEERNSCWKDITLNFRKEVDVNEGLKGLKAYSAGLISTYATERSLDLEFAEKWATCFGGCRMGGFGRGEGFHWWGVDRSFEDDECSPSFTESTRPSRLPKAYPRIGTFVADANVCFEGPYDYMVAALARSLETPFYRGLTNATVSETSCADLGFDKVRDTRDDCWPEAAKVMRSDTEGKDMGNWVMGPESMFQLGKRYDEENGLPEKTGLDLIICHACEKGGAQRDRGLMYTMDGGTFIPRYSNAFCQDAIEHFGLRRK